jgi:prephenate dehydrogenase
MDEPSFTRLADARVAIVGLGLMGGSLAMALAGRCQEIIGVDVDPVPLDSALQRGIVHRTADFNEALTDSNFIIFSTPVRTLVAQLETLQKLETQRATIVMDLGSTKSAIVNAMAQLPEHFDPIGGHPMCGKEISGLGNADPDLYRGKTFVLCPLPRTTPRTVVLANELVALIGAHPLVLEAEVHDQIAAMISHLPHAVSAAVMRAALANTSDVLWQMAASGFRDSTRLAASDLTMMTDMLLTNREAVLAALAQFKTELDVVTQAIEANDPAALRAALEPAQRKRSGMFK